MPKLHCNQVTPHRWTESLSSTQGPLWLCARCGETKIRQLSDEVGKGTYKFEYNDQTKFIEAWTYSSARRIFMEEYGFWPMEDTVNITLLSKVKTNNEQPVIPGATPSTSTL